jgi:hypothetical protein
MTDTTSPPWEPPVAGSEAEHLVAALDRLRATLRWKADGLDADGLRASIPSSTLTLGGLLKHLALVEDHYFTSQLAGESLEEIWGPLGYDGSDDEWEFTSAASDPPEGLYGLYDAAVARSRDRLAESLERDGLDQPVDLGWTDGRRPSLRRLLCDLLEEYGRHTGHADLLREAVDGRTGEDPPSDWRP